MATKMTMPRSGRGTGSYASSNPTPSGVPQGTPGGTTRAMAGSMTSSMGSEMYLWVLVILEVGAIAWLRKSFRRHHGG
jgi:hypothetical protein